MSRFSRDFRKYLGSTSIQIRTAFQSEEPRRTRAAAAGRGRKTAAAGLVVVPVGELSGGRVGLRQSSGGGELRGVGGADGAAGGGVAWERAGHYGRSRRPRCRKVLGQNFIFFRPTGG